MNETVQKQLASVIGGILVALILTIGLIAMLSSFGPIKLLIGVVVGMIVGVAAYYAFNYAIDSMKKAQAESVAKAADAKRNDFSNIGALAGVSAADFKRIVLGARDQLETLRELSVGLTEANQAIGVRAIADVGDKIIDEVLRDPKDFTTARTWFNSHLPQVVDVVKKYLNVVDLDHTAPGETIAGDFTKTREDFNALLKDIFDKFSKLSEDLKINDTNALKVDIAVLNDQLKG